MEALSARHASGPNGTSLLNLPQEVMGHVCVVPTLQTTMLLQRGEAAGLVKAMQLANERAWL